MNTMNLQRRIDLKPLILLAALAFLTGCHIAGIKGNGNVTTETRTVTDFTSVEADGVFEIQWQNGPATLSIQTDQNLLAFVETNVNGNKLRIHSRQSLRPTKGMKVMLSSSAMTAARLTGAVRFTAAKISGSGFYLDATGATRVNLDGTVNELLASMTGASRLDAGSLQTQTAELSISGAGRADVAASTRLKVAISGAGKVTYTGNPTIEKDISGAGSVKRRE